MTASPLWPGSQLVSGRCPDPMKLCLSLSANGVKVVSAATRQPGLPAALKECNWTQTSGWWSTRNYQRWPLQWPLTTAANADWPLQPTLLMWHRKIVLLRCHKCFFLHLSILFLLFLGCCYSSIFKGSELRAVVFYGLLFPCAGVCLMSPADTFTETHTRG